MPTVRTFEPLAYTSLTGTAATIEFTSISSSYTDLTFILMGKLDTTNNTFKFRLNGDTASNYRSIIYGATNGTGLNWGVEQRNGTSGLLGWITSGNVSMLEFTLFNYADTNMYKALMGSGMYSATRAALTHGAVWNSTSAVTSIAFSPDGGNFATGFSITMYGIKKA